MSGNSEKINGNYAPDCKYCNFISEDEEEQDPYALNHCYVIKSHTGRDLGFLNAKAAVEDSVYPRTIVQLDYDFEYTPTDDVIKSIGWLECNKCSMKFFKDILTEMVKTAIRRKEFSFGDD